MDIEKIIGETTEYDKKQLLEIRKPKSWCKSISAFANGIGGKLIFGVSDTSEIVGLKQAESDAEIISETIKTRLNPIPEFCLSFHEIGGKALIIVEVQKGNETPYYYSADGNMIAFHRVGNQSVVVSPKKLNELILRGGINSYDSLKSRYKYEDVAFTKLKSTYKQRIGISFGELDYESFGIIDEEGNLTNAGALLADESPTKHSRVFCTRWNGLDKASGLMEAVDDKEYVGGLINLLQDSMNFVINNSKKAWKKVPDGRVEMPDYPERAVLEGIVNSLIHRDYLEVGSEVHIDMFDDRIEIYSPGGMLDGTRVQERDILNIPSRRRNPIIADIFNRLKYMDRRGSGFKKIVGCYQTQTQYVDKMMPEFESDYDSFLLILKNLNYSKKSAIKSGDKKAAINSSSKISAKMLNQHKMILEYMEEGTEYTLQDFCELLELKDSRVKIIMKGLLDSGIICPTGKNRNRKYIKY